ncbi:MAG: glycosyltransferase family 4 protein [Candidatus Poribacteria bacterium]|nr:glycosyltransferase family 4 protein [Candidatus Poribacteria bacterium]MDE0504763.1 glycosyltransferase family 4 protein [Candidatus Poribacteria bacterium]
MTRILYLSGSIFGGAERQLLYLVTNLDKSRYEPMVVCPEDGVFPEQLRAAGIDTAIHPLPAWRKWKYLLHRYAVASRLGQFTTERQVGLIHVADSWHNPYSARIARQCGIPTVSHVKAPIRPDQVVKYGFHDMSSIISISEQFTPPFLAAGISPDKINVIVNCVDLCAFQTTRADQNAHRSEFPLRRFVIGMVGRIEPFKRQKEFVEVASHVLNMRQDVSFLIIGGTQPNVKHIAYERELRQLISELNLADFITVTGHREDMPAIMQGLDLLVTLSAGSVIPEAMAAGKPVLATPVGSATDMIDDGITGWVVPPLPIEGIAAKIVQMIQNPSLCEQMGRAARVHAENHFSIARHVEQVQSIYDRLILEPLT